MMSIPNLIKIIENTIFNTSRNKNSISALQAGIFFLFVNFFDYFNLPFKLMLNINQNVLLFGILES